MVINHMVGVELVNVNTTIKKIYKYVLFMNMK